MNYEILSMLLGFVTLVVLGIMASLWRTVAKLKVYQELSAELDKKINLKDTEYDKKTQEVIEQGNEIARLQEKLSGTTELYVKSEKRLMELIHQYDTLKREFTLIQARKEEIEKKLEDNNKQYEELNKLNRVNFENLATKILTENSKLFKEQNVESLSSVLTPLKENIERFEKRIATTHDENLKRNASLAEHIKLLNDMNKQLSDEANNLTKALKGNVKAQGNWGEVILERLLEESGLLRDIHYVPQSAGMGLKNSEGKQVQPDVMVKLPREKHIIIDSKVSLIAYEKYVSAETDEQRASALKDLNVSLKAHIDGLHSKHYTTAIDGLDLVFMFIPIEGCYFLALREFPELYKYAYDRKIVLVSSTNLLVSMRTVSFLWQQENQSRNALEIAQESGKLYDKFVAFTEDLKKIGAQMDTVQKTYDGAMNKLSTGRGNLVRRAENIKKLGAKATKAIDSNLTKTDELLIEEETDND